MLLKQLLQFCLCYWTRVSSGIYLRERESSWGRRRWNSERSIRGFLDLRYIQ